MSAAEASGDAHCAALIEAIKKNRDNVEFVGVGGEKMSKAGCFLLGHTAGKGAMLTNAYKQIWFFYKTIRQIRTYLKNNKVDIVIVCDSPSFNFHIAKAANKQAIPTLFYVAPQLWAWAPWRIKKLKKCCTKLAAILPFEVEWFGQRGVDCEFVGNPMVENLAPVDLQAKDYSNFSSDNAKVALLPGSRTAEIEKLWLPMQQIAGRLKQRYKNIQFIAVAANEKIKAELQQSQLEDIEIEYRTDAVYQTAKQSDFAITASGSATLQLASAGCPMVVMYQSNRYLAPVLKKVLVNIDLYCLVNILAGEELVPEFMPYFTSIEPIADKCEQLLDDKDKLGQVSCELIEIVKPLTAKKASQQAAQIVAELIENH